MHVCHLPIAAAPGATILSSAKVSKILVEKGRAVGVEGPGLRVRARRVVLACGAVHTPELLQRNRLGGPSGQLGRNLRIHPGAAALGPFDRGPYAFKGVLQSYS